MKVIACVALAAALLAGCASEPSHVHTDVYCVEQRPTVIIAGNKVIVADGGCRAWVVGPTPRERAQFNQDHGIEEKR